MKPLLGLLACALLIMGLAACGASHGDTTVHGVADRPATSGGSKAHRKKDRDNDEDNNDDDYHVLDFGHVADAADNQTIKSILVRYFAIAASGDGARACSMLTPFIAESVVEVDGHAPVLRGHSCAVVMSKLFKQHHVELVGKSAGLKVVRVGVEGDRSIVALEFSEIPVVRQISLRRVGNRWTVLDLLDGLLE